MVLINLSGVQKMFIITFNGRILHLIFLIDISGFIEKKLQAIQAYSSQFFDPNSNEPETLISNKNFYKQCYK